MDWFAGGRCACVGLPWWVVGGAVLRWTAWQVDGLAGGRPGRWKGGGAASLLSLCKSFPVSALRFAGESCCTVMY